MPAHQHLKLDQAAFDRGEIDLGLTQTHAFQNKVRVLVPVTQPALSARLIQSAQDIIDAINSGRALLPQPQP